MGKTAMLRIQNAINAKLNGDTTLTGMVNEIADFIPQNTPYPYIVIGDMNEVPFDTFGRDGKNVTAFIHIYSDFEGFEECYNILDRLNFLLDDTDLSVSGYSTVYIHYENAYAFRTRENNDIEGRIRQVTAKYRVIVQEV